MGGSPIAFSCVCPHPSPFFFQSQLFEIGKAGFYFLPAFPGQHPYPASHPFVQRFQYIFHIRQLEIIDPAPHDLQQSFFSSLNSHSITASGNLSDFILQLLDALGVNSQSSLSPVDIESITEEFHFCDVDHLCFLPIYSKKQFPFDKRCDVFKGSFGGFPAFAENHQLDLLQLLYRHQTGDWGDLEDEDKESNEEALINDTRIFSSYSIAEDKIWIITEADRSLTTFLMPSDY